MLLTFAYFTYFAVIALHLAFAVVEMVLWKRFAPTLFHMSPDQAAQTAKLASNQGLYNVFLALALFLGYFATNSDASGAFMLYGLSCVIAAGIWGGITVSKTIFFVQAVPAIVAFILWFVVMP